MGIAGSPTPEQLESFHSQGFLAIESFATADEVQGMTKRMEELLDDFDCTSIKSIFSTISHKHGSDDYFLDSAEKISFFFEEKAFGDDGELKQPKQLSINKVGHALHEIDPVFKKFSYSEKMSSLLLSLHYRRPVIIQSMYIFKFLHDKKPGKKAKSFHNWACKPLLPNISEGSWVMQPGIGGEVVPHQDNSFLYTEPRSCTGLWLALEDATITNGCLWAIPGSHKNGLVRRFIRDDNGVHFDHPSPSYIRHDFVPIEVKAGSLVVIHGDLVHQSFQNMSSKSRHAFSLHAVETDRCTWTSDNWIRRKEEPEPVYVS